MASSHKIILPLVLVGAGMAASGYEPAVNYGLITFAVGLTLAVVSVLFR
ncbi:MAG: hypothetical protein OH338_01425 [Candidatus Parvarchaeota archaeon]|nr:hypothetical protein [Candidatus Parvarchaeum tengchongense]MCW1298975.1 hypothetical protein [Candidatus Parvarchaeum tengchongense]MCW1312075.1 hypothetical protein [Candidatus Parvarchaeum tengchongense]